MGIQIHELATKSGNLSSSDYLVTDNGTVTAKIDYTKLAKAIVEQYNGSTLAGSAQTLQSALNGLNTNTENMYTKTGTVIASDGEDLNAYWTVGKYYCQSSARAQTLQNCPTDAGFSLYVIRRTTGGGTQLIEDNVGELYIRYNNTNGSTTAWQPWRSITKSDALEASFANYGCKNILGNNSVIPIGYTKTENGITFTVQSDGSVKVTGTATANAFLNYFNGASDPIPLPDKSITKLTASLGGGTSATHLHVDYYKSGGSTTAIGETTGADWTFTIPSTAVSLRVYLYIDSGTTIDTTLYPMLRPANIPDDTYVPYAPNNAELAPLLEQSWMTFSNTALLTTQAEALARGHYFGICNTYQHQTETGAPLNNANSYIEVYVQNSSWIGIKLSPISNIGSIYYKTKNNGTWTEWTHTIAS